MDLGTLKIRLNTLTGRHYPLMLSLWAAALGTLAIVAAAGPLAGSLGWGRWIPGAVISLGGPARVGLAVGLASWLLLLLLSPSSAWYGWRFRYLAWTTTRVLARFLVVLRRALPLGLVLLVVWWQRDALLHPQKIPWLALLGEGMLAAILLALLAGAYRARNSIMILPFEDYTGDSALGVPIQGLAASLRSELAAITMVYRVIDEAWSNPQGRNDLVPRVEAASDSLQSAVAPDAKLSLGFVSVPLGTMMTMISHLVRGPRLKASVHRQGDEIVLTAELQGGGRAGSWIVRPTDDPRPPAAGTPPLRFAARASMAGCLICCWSPPPVTRRMATTISSRPCAMPRRRWPPPPLGAWERRQLAAACFALSDYRRAEDELLRSLDLNPDDPETVSLIAKLYWNQGVFASSPEFRRDAFQKVIERLERALALLESERLNGPEADVQLDSRASIHHYLGTFHAELLRFEDGIHHQRIALAMGYKPIQARLALAWAYYEARAYDQAQRELRDAVREGRRREKGRGTLRPAAAPGEETPINELLVAVYVLWAQLLGETGTDLARAERLIRFARRRIGRLGQSQRPAFTEVQLAEPRELRSLFHQARAAVLLARGDFPGSAGECERSLAQFPRGGAWLLLARACLAGGREGTMDMEPARERARAALGRAGESDLRGIHRAEIAEVSAQLG